VNPFDDMDNEDEGGVSFSELPPSVRARVQPQQAEQAQAQIPQQIPQPMPRPPPHAYAPQVHPQARPAYGAGPTQAPPLAPIGMVGTGQPIYQPVYAQTVPPPPAPPEDKSPLLFIGATLLLGGLGYWAYTKMEKDSRKRGALPRPGQVSDYGDDSDSDTDDGQSGGPLDDYEDSALPEKDVDPHEEGGIKLVKG
jgi:hypothetical protein